MRMIVLAATIGLAALAGLPAAVRSEEPVATAAPADSHPPGASASPAPIDTSLDEPSTDRTIVDGGPCGPATSPNPNTSGAPDTRPRGEIGVGVGTNGYRDVEGFVCKPLANGGAIAIGVGEQQSQWGRR